MFLTFPYMFGRSLYYNTLQFLCKKISTGHSLKSVKRVWDRQCCLADRTFYVSNSVLPPIIGVQSFSF